MLEIQSSKIVLTLVDTETGELFTKEATFGDFKEVTKKATTRTKKIKDDGDPVSKIILLDNKIQFNKAAIDLTGFEPEMKIDVKFEKKGRIVTPVLCQDSKTGNRLTKTYTISFRGSRHDNLAEHGDIFELIPYPDKEGYFKLKGNAPEKEDDIVEIPEEITDPEDGSLVDPFEEGNEIDFNLDL